MLNRHFFRSPNPKFIEFSTMITRKTPFKSLYNSAFNFTSFSCSNSTKRCDSYENSASALPVATMLASHQPPGQLLPLQTTKMVEEVSIFERFCIKNQRDLSFSLYSPFGMSFGSCNLKLDNSRDYIDQDLWSLKAIAQAYEMSYKCRGDDEAKIGNDHSLEEVSFIDINEIMGIDDEEDDEFNVGHFINGDIGYDGSDSESESDTEEDESDEEDADDDDDDEEDVDYDRDYYRSDASTVSDDYNDDYDYRYEPYTDAGSNDSDILSEHGSPWLH